MNLLQLRLFRDIARELSFVKTARQNHITQPAVSTHIKNLEEELGVKLFNRAPRSVQLTPEGRSLLPDIEEILQRCDSLKLRSDYGRVSHEGSVRVAAIHSIGMYELGEFLTTFMKTFPKIHVHLQYRRADVIYDLILKKKVELGLVAYPEKRTNIESLLYGEDNLVVIVHKDHNLSSRKSISLKQINGLPFIAFDDGVPTREAIDSMLRKANVALDVRMTNDNIYALKKAVESGIGISIVPSSSVKDEVRNGTLRCIRIRDFATKRPLSIIKLKKSSLSPAAQIFEDMLYRPETLKIPKNKVANI